MLTQNFHLAAFDYQFLLNRGYLPGSILEMVSSRHRLSSIERSMLYRGISSDADQKLRAAKLMSKLKFSPDLKFYIDGLNVLITIASYLQGLPVFIAGDGMLRDASNLRGKIQIINRFDQAVELLISFLVSITPSKSILYLDKQGETHQQINQSLINSSNWNDELIFIEISDQVDKELVTHKDGIVCTSDSEIIDATGCRVFDLAKAVLVNAFKPDFPDLRNLSSNKAEGEKE